MAFSLRRRLLESENQVNEALGDVPALLRSDFEDALIQALEDTHITGRLDGWRSFIRQWSKDAGFPEEFYNGNLSQDWFAWLTVHTMSTHLRRMLHRWERSANILRREGLPYGDGTRYLMA